jgi:polar amino acid transport system ATP-binding protein
MLSPGAAPSAEYLLEARGVRKSFGAHEVLKGVDLFVAPGQMVFLIGPSGSGKSTLLRCCNRLEEPSGGSIRIAGVDLLSPRTDINAMRREIGMVFQNFNLYPHMTVLGNVALALRKVMKKPRAEAEEIAHANRPRARARSEDHPARRADLRARSRTRR